MALTTQYALEMSVKQARTIADVLRAYGGYDHRISQQERQVLYELVGVLAETKDLAINTTLNIHQDRWDG